MVNAAEFFYYVGKDPHWYNVQVSDTTMIHIAASLPGQKVKNITAYAIKIYHLSNYQLKNIQFIN